MKKYLRSDYFLDDNEKNQKEIGSNVVFIDHNKGNVFHVTILLESQLQMTTVFYKTRGFTNYSLTGVLSHLIFS